MIELNRLIYEVLIHILSKGLVKPNLELAQMKFPTRVLIQPDGSIKTFEWKVKLEEVRQYLQADTLDTVSMIDGIHVMIVDDTGALTQRPVNIIATALYMMKCRHQNTWRIHGPVFILPDSDFIKETGNASQVKSSEPPDASSSGREEPDSPPKRGQGICGEH
jgi:hypothetical protein